MSADFFHILKLVDDPDPTVKAAVEKYFQQFEGDISEQLAGAGIGLTKLEQDIIAPYLIAGRRKILADAWVVPNRFLSNDSVDWETFEHLLSLLADYLHDGTSLRPSLADSLDQISDEIHLSGLPITVDGLSEFLFKQGRFSGNRKEYFAKENSDLVWVIHNNKGNPVSLVVLFMLLAQRFNLDVQGCNYPGHFLAWVDDAESSYLIDTYNQGRVLKPKKVMRDNPNISENARESLSGPCSLNAIIQRTLNNVEASFEKEDLLDELPFIQRLRKSLQPVHIS